MEIRHNGYGILVLIFRLSFIVYIFCFSYLKRKTANIMTSVIAGSNCLSFVIHSVQIVNIIDMYSVICILFVFMRHWKETGGKLPVTRHYLLREAISLEMIESSPENWMPLAPLAPLAFFASELPATSFFFFLSLCLQWTAISDFLRECVRRSIGLIVCPSEGGKFGMIFMCVK